MTHAQVYDVIYVSKLVRYWGVKEASDTIMIMEDMQGSNAFLFAPNSDYVPFLFPFLNSTQSEFGRSKNEFNLTVPILIPKVRSENTTKGKTETYS